MSDLMPVYFGRFEGPDHLNRCCPALARVKPWRDPWPDLCVDLIDLDDLEAGDVCGWCVWDYRRKRR